jgi:aspartyl-tRNA(Asn)/glutamyl-tRNA(Gln) amidotransferase subunit C
LRDSIVCVSAPLSIEEVERIAALANLELTDDEKQLFARQLADILSYAQQIQQLDTSGVPATAHVHAGLHPNAPNTRVGDPGLRAERDDEPKPSLPVGDAMANAPEAALPPGLFKVPQVIGG